MRRVLVTAAAVLGAFCIGPAAAVAHPLLVQAAPSPGLVDPHAPQSIQLAFSEPAVARGSSIVLGGPGGGNIPVAAIVAQNGGRTLSVTPAHKLASAVYSVRWVALGNDGHTVSGDFSFGIAGPHGRPPAGAGRLQAQAGAAGTGSERAGADPPLLVATRWLGLVAASLLAAGPLLVRLLRRRERELGALVGARWRALSPLALAALLVSSLAGVAGSPGLGSERVSLSLLTASPTGRVALLRLAFVAVSAIATAVLCGRPRAFAAVAATAGVGGLTTFALSGHALSAAGPAYVDELVHVLAAGLWLGCVLLLAVVAKAASPGQRRRAARAFAPAAATLVLVAVAAGVLAAVREVDAWYFLRWSTYGRVVLAKSALVVLALAFAGFAMGRGRGTRSPAPRLIRGEAVGLLAVVALAAVLSGLAQGRGQLLPAQRGTLLPGPAVAGTILGNGSARLVVAPARPGLNTVALTLTGPAARASRVALRFSCACSRARVIAPLARPRAGGEWSASVWLPASGPWFAYLTIGSRTASSPAVLRIGIPHAPGAPVANVLSLADLSGPDGARCRAHEIGLELALGRVNAAGGVGGGRKIAPYVLDDGGDPAQALSLAASALRSHPLAVVPCGHGGEAAVRAAGKAGIPSLVGDPAVAAVAAPRAFRTAGDPFAEGVATAQYLKQMVAPSSAAGARTIWTLTPEDASAARFASGLRSAKGPRLHIAQISAAHFTAASGRALARLLDRRHTLAFVLDGPAGTAYAPALRRLSAASPAIPPAPVVASERVLSEQLVESAGELGRIAALQGMSEVTPDGADALVYARAVPAIYPGETPSLDGLRGYIAGLALRAALRGGTGPSALESRLRRPARFSDSLESPWRSDAPAAGSVRFVALAPRFLAATLIPVSAGGESYNGSFFPDGAWTRLSSNLFGPPLSEPVPRF